jgi:hypothetical protein
VVSRRRAAHSERTDSGLLSRPSGIRMLVAFALSFLANTSSAQVVPEYDRYTPLRQNVPPGQVARWADLAGKTDPNYFQPVRIINEEGGDITLYHRRPVQQAAYKSPAQMSVIAGHSYRFKLSNMKELPGIDVFPTIEIFDRLHPPAGEKHNFPIPIHISRSDIDQVIQGKLVTHIIYLEQPQFAAPFALDDSTRTRRLKPRDNAFEMADRLGRPMIILRIGGRVPSVHGEPITFWGTGGRIANSAPSEIAAKKKEAIPQPNGPANGNTGAKQ